MKKWYFEYFIADYFPALNKKDPVVTDASTELEQAGRPDWSGILSIL